MRDDTTRPDERPADSPGEAAGPGRPRRTRLRLAAFVLAVLVIVLARPAAHHARATSLLMAFSDPAAVPSVTEERFVFDGDGAPIPARLYSPSDTASAPGVVLVHGVHRKGIDEPRLERFARALAGAGVIVMTPTIAELQDYRVAPRSIDTVGAAVLALGARLGAARVGLMGMSFGGGIALLAAADARFAERVSFVVAVGAHDDLERVSRFFVDDEIREPSGATQRQRAHPYGATVLVYAHAEAFFPPEDVDGARVALRLWLWEERTEARAATESLSPASKEKVEGLFEAGAASMKEELRAGLTRFAREMKDVSPHGRLANLRAPVYLLHGEGDAVIPSAETLWLAASVPPDRLRSVLVSPAIEHVELKAPSAADKWALVHFMGRVIGEAEASR